MELPASAYLLNLSLIGITFAAVSALVMLLRQSMGGKITNFDVYLTTSYVEFGFVIAIDPMLPLLLGVMKVPEAALWPAASVIAALLLGTSIAQARQRRRKATPAPRPLATTIAVTCYWFAVIVLAANAILPPLRNAGAFAFALTFFTAVLMWSFVRRMSSLISATSGEDWDPRRG
jgi:hypothetical protein